MEIKNQPKDEPEFILQENSLLFTIANEANNEGEISCDLAVGGDVVLLSQGLAAKMLRHPILAQMLCNACFNYYEQVSGIIN